MAESPLNIKRKIILGSGSPRRQALLKELGVEFITLPKNTEESYPDSLSCSEVAEYVAGKKAVAYDKEVNDGMMVITADTIVCLDDHVIGKPEDEEDAVRLLNKLSGRTHTVVTAVCIRIDEERILFSESTDVSFHKMTENELLHYVEKYAPMDKAGAYGIQEWIGLTAIKSINGSYHNVMGLPASKLYQVLKDIES